MNEFWLWFWRPIAEVLGVFAMLAAFGGLFAAYYYIGHWLIERGKRKRAVAAERRAEVEAKARAAL